MAATACGCQSSFVSPLVPCLSVETEYDLASTARDQTGGEGGVGEGDGVSDKGGGRDKHVGRGGREKENSRRGKMDVCFGYK